MTVIANNYEHNLPQKKECDCGEEMKLELLEDKCRNVSYEYRCISKYCKAIEKVKVDE